MSSAGHIMDMINRMKQNRSHRQSTRAKFKENNREAIYSKSDKKSGQLLFKTVSEKELIEIKNRIQKNAEKERKRELILYGIIFLFGLIALMTFLYWIN